MLFFFKQWGEWDKKKAGRILDGRTYDEMPPRTSNPVPSKKECLEMIEQVKAMMAKGHLFWVDGVRRSPR